MDTTIQWLRENPGLTVRALAEINLACPGIFEGITLGEVIPRGRAEVYAGRMLVLLRCEGAMASGEILERLGGRRWDVQAAARLLERRGVVEREGRTGTTRYRAVRRGARSGS
jgi:hypothetical protein